jgi:L-alanine-DL-glutamate epimerase-like enolase superfamily enzyme
LEITDVRVRVFQFPPTPVTLIPQTNGTLRSVPGASRTMRIVEVMTDEGYAGICPCDENLQQWEDRVRGLLLGEDPGRMEYLWMKLFGGTHRKRCPKGEWVRSIGYVDIALWDLVGQMTKQPVHRLLGGFRDRVPVYAAGGYYQQGKTPEELGKELAGFVEQGYHYVKMKVGAWVFGVSLREDVRRVRAARDAIGDDVELMVDANNAWDAKSAIRFIRAVERYEPYWFEEPVMPDDYAGSGEVKAATSVFIASGENEYSQFGARDLITSRSIDVLQIDPGVCGGFTPIRKAAALAETEHIWFAPHGGHVLGATPVAAAPNGLIVESYPASKWRPKVPIDAKHPEVVLLEEPNPIADGWITMNTRPGIGYILHEEVAARYEVNPRPARRQPTGRTPAKQWGDLLVRQPNLADSWI